MELLPKTYNRGTPAGGVFTHIQLRRDSKKALYKLFIGTRCVGYELFFIKVQKECDVVMGGVNVHMAEKEMLPGNNAFGFWAWSYGNIGDENAIERFNNLVVPEIDSDQPRRRGRPSKQPIIEK